MTATIRYGAAFAVLALIAGPALAQAPEPRRPGGQDPAQKPAEKKEHTQHAQDMQRAKPDFQLMRYSELKGKTVKNKADNELGRIQDLAVAPDSGRISYAAVSFGGFLGLGDKLFAVPLDALDIKSTDRIVLDVTKEQLENAEGFDDDNWPVQPNPRFASDLRSRRMGGMEGTRGSELAGDEQRQRRTGEMGETDRTRGSQLAGDEERAARQGKAHGSEERITKIKKASDLVGKDIKNRQGEELGSVKDLIVDPDRARVCIAVISHEGGDELCAVPWQSFEMAPEKDKDHLILNVDKNKLTSAPKTKLDDRATWNNPDWVKTVYSYYTVEPYWQHESDYDRGRRDM